MAKKKIVEFRRGHQRYNKGERAGFDAETAEKLCEGKDPIAKMIGDAKVAAPAPAAGKGDKGDAEALAAAKDGIEKLEADKAALQKQVEALEADKAALADEVAALKAAAKAPAKDDKAAPGQPPKTK